MPYPAVPFDTVPMVTVEQMAEADRLAIEVFGIELLQMMEHAGAALADLVAAVADDGSITVLAGGGNNGGGGLCAARHLINRGRRVDIVLAGGHRGAAVEHHLRTLRAMDAPIRDRPGDTPIVLDALVGYGLDGPLRGRVAELAAWSTGRTAVSLDFPSGHGYPGAVEPTATLTLALPKAGLEALRPLFLADLGLPAELWAAMGLEFPDPFARGAVVEIR